MVEVSEKLYVDAKDFFDSIAQSVAYDISEATGKSVLPEHIKKGLKYTKEMKNKVKRKGNVKIKITKWNPPYSYSAEFGSINGTNTLSYEIKQIDPGVIGVNYMEDFIGTSKSKDLNFKLVSVFYKRKAKKRAIRLLRALEKYAQEQKVKKEEAVELIAD